MKQRWPEVRLGDVLELKRGYDLPRDSRTAGDVPVVSSSGKSGHHCVAKARGPGVVTGRYGTLGEVFYVREDFWPLNTTLYVRDFKNSHRRFCSYFLKTVDLMSCSDKAAVPGLNRNHLHELKVRVPPLATQQAIASILGALDDKIELNRRTNETLEAMTRALFQSWFVDFDPVRAKMEGRQPEGMDAETATLFPSEMHLTKGGLVPRGWVVATLGESVARGVGGGLQTGPFGSQLHASDYVAHGIPSIMPKNIIGGRVSIQSIARVRVGDAERLGHHRVRSGDLVFSRRGDVEKHALITDEESGWLCGTGCLRVRFGKGGIPPVYASSWLSLTFVKEWLTRHAVGATMPNLNTRILGSAPFLLVSEGVQRAFSDMAEPMTRTANQLDRESATLASLRDTLLPRLLSGELHILDVEVDG